MLVIGKVALLPGEGASRVDLRTESALSTWLAMHHFDTWDYLRFLSQSVPLPLSGLLLPLLGI